MLGAQWLYHSATSIYHSNVGAAKRNGADALGNYVVTRESIPLDISFVRAFKKLENGNTLTITRGRI